MKKEIRKREKFPSVGMVGHFYEVLKDIATTLMVFSTPTMKRALKHQKPLKRILRKFVKAATAKPMTWKKVQVPYLVCLKELIAYYSNLKRKGVK